MKDFFGRAPFTFLSAIGLLSITSSIVEWQSDLRVLIDAYSAISSFLWTYTLSWLEPLLNFKMPLLGKQYLLMTLIVLGSGLRSSLKDNTNWSWRDYLGLLELALLWPILLPVALVAVWLNREYRSGPTYLFFESFVWALIIIAINYALIFSGA